MLRLIFVCSLVIIGIGIWKFWKLEIVQVEGKSMLPTYKHGRLVLIRKRLSFPKDIIEQKVYVFTNPYGYLVIKRLKGKVFQNGTMYLWFEGDNKDNSEDSRHYGFVRTEGLEGILVFSKSNKTVDKGGKTT